VVRWPQPAHGDGRAESVPVRGGGPGGPTPDVPFRGLLRGTNDRPITIAGLKALQVGNGVSSGDANAIYFTAARDNGRHGLFGSLRVASGS